MSAEFDVAMLKVELQRLRVENAQLHRNARRRAAYIARVNRAHGDALLFLSLRAGGIQPSRQYAQDRLQIGRRRWQWAIGLLKLARLYRTSQPDDPSILRRLDAAKDEALTDPVVLKLKIGRHGRDASRVRKVGYAKTGKRTQ